MKRNKIFSVLGILAGVVAIVLAVCVYTAKPADTEEPFIPSSPVTMTEMDIGTRTSYSYYGGDAYTGIQQAAADTARNVRSLAAINNKGFDVSARAINNAAATVRNSALAVISSMNSSRPDYRLPFSAVLLIMGLSLILSSLRSLNEIDARSSYEASVLEALKGIGSGIPFPAGSEEEEPMVSEPLPEEPEEEEQFAGEDLPEEPEKKEETEA